MSILMGFGETECESESESCNGYLLRGACSEVLSLTTQTAAPASLQTHTQTQNKQFVHRQMHSSNMHVLFGSESVVIQLSQIIDLSYYFHN